MTRIVVQIEDGNVELYTLDKDVTYYRVDYDDDEAPHLPAVTKCEAVHAPRVVRAAEDKV